MKNLCIHDYNILITDYATVSNQLAVVTYQLASLAHQIQIVHSWLTFTVFDIVYHVIKSYMSYFGDSIPDRKAAGVKTTSASMS